MKTSERIIKILRYDRKARTYFEMKPNPEYESAQFELVALDRITGRVSKLETYPHRFKTEHDAMQYMRSGDPDYSVAPLIKATHG